MRGPDTDFEFERRFFVARFPQELIGDSKPNLVVQTYFLASQGYGLRIRLQATAYSGALDVNMDGKSAIEAHIDDFDLCVLAAKGPYVGGTRYEAERELDVSVGAQMCLRGGTTLVKLRHGVWFGEDGWVIDQFGGENHPLTIAECERTSPVIDLDIPWFCTEEVTNDHRFSNDELTNNPFGNWATAYLENAKVRKPRFSRDFGTNRTAPN